MYSHLVLPQSRFIHWTSVTHGKGQRPPVLVKVDSKAVINASASAGRTHRWVGWIMSCLTTVSYSFNINGESKEYVIPSRGIRQGDPLSPYLFLICSEGFSSLLAKAARRRELTGLKICRHGPELTHLFFADDTLIFCRADKENAQKLKQILKVYEEGSGQLVNMEKSSVFFSKNTEQTIRDEVGQILSDIQQASQGKYLGLPMVITRDKSQVFGFIKEKVKTRLQSWKNKQLSPAGKEVMLKAVIMALPTYVMSVFKLSSKLCKEITAWMANFWWGEEKGRKKMHWCSWAMLSKEKKWGGLGFKDLICFNKAMLGKQVWRIFNDANLLVSKVLKAKYFPNQSIFNCKVPRNSSWIWLSLMTAREEVERGTWKLIGNGRNTRIWDDRWIFESSTGKPTTEKPVDCELVRVEDLIVNFRWDREAVLRYFNKEDAGKILNMPVSISGREDRNIWVYSRQGQYTVSSNYHRLMQEARKVGKNQDLLGESSVGNSNNQIWRELWKMNIKYKLKIFIWKCIHNMLPGKENIFRRTQNGSPVCCECGEGIETVEHILFQCRKAQIIWKLAPIHWDGLQHHTACFKNWWAEVIQAKSRQEGRDHIALTVNILWQIWKARNKKEFERKSTEELKVIDKACREWKEFDAAQRHNPHRSTAETDEAEQVQRRESTDENCMVLKISVARQRKFNHVGIGVVASWGDQVRAEWAITEQTSDSRIQDEGQAVRLALSKAFEQGWRRVKVEIKSKGLVAAIQANCPTNLRITRLIEDISQLTNVFHMCSFCFDNTKVKDLSYNLSIYALRLPCDEERVYPLLSAELH